MTPTIRAAGQHVGQDDGEERGGGAGRLRVGGRRRHDERAGRRAGQCPERGDMLFAAVVATVGDARVGVGVALDSARPGKCLTVAATPPRSRAVDVPSRRRRSPWPWCRRTGGRTRRWVRSGAPCRSGRRPRRGRGRGSRRRSSARSPCARPGPRAPLTAAGASWPGAAGSKPGPWRAWTAPPSWSAATHRAGPGAIDCQCPVVRPAGPPAPWTGRRGRSCRSRRRPARPRRSGPQAERRRGNCSTRPARPAAPAPRRPVPPPAWSSAGPGSSQQTWTTKPTRSDADRRRRRSRPGGQGAEKCEDRPPAIPSSSPFERRTGVWASPPVSQPATIRIGEWSARSALVAPEGWSSGTSTRTIRRPSGSSIRHLDKSPWLAAAPG